VPLTPVARGVGRWTIAACWPIRVTGLLPRHDLPDRRADGLGHTAANRHHRALQQGDQHCWSRFEQTTFCRDHTTAPATVLTTLPIAISLSPRGGGQQV